MRVHPVILLVSTEGVEARLVVMLHTLASDPCLLEEEGDLPHHGTAEGPQVLAVTLLVQGFIEDHPVHVVGGPSVLREVLGCVDRLP